MTTIELINDIMNKYYVTREIKNDVERNNTLKYNVALVQFNEAVDELINEITFESVQNIILTGFILNFFNKENEKSLQKLLCLNFHKNHEDIAGLFQRKFYNNLENISVLLQSLNNIPDYLSPEDFKYPYIRKIIYAIGAQPEPYNIEALEKIANETEDEQIKELALHQIKKRKEFGRWESAENIK